MKSFFFSIFYTISHKQCFNSYDRWRMCHSNAHTHASTMNLPSFRIAIHSKMSVNILSAVIHSIETTQTVRDDQSRTLIYANLFR